MCKISYLIVFCLAISFGDSIYNPSELSTKPPYTRKEWRTIAINPEELNNIQMHHNYSRVYVQKSRESKSHTDQIQEGSQHNEQISRFDFQQLEDPKLSTIGKIEQIPLDDKLDFKSGITVNDKLNFDQTVETDQQIVQTRPGLIQNQQEQNQNNVNDKLGQNFQNNNPPFHYVEVNSFLEMKPFSNMAFETCPKNATGQLVYLWSCNQYLNCWKGRKHLQNCPPGTLFNPEALECDYSHKVDCISGPHYQKVKFEKYIAAPNRNTGYARNAIKNLCSPGFSGLIAHPSICTKFINCANGQTFVQDCGPGTAFNSKILACDWPHKVDCDLYELTDRNIRVMSNTRRQNYQQQSEGRAQSNHCQTPNCQTQENVVTNPHIQGVMPNNQPINPVHCNNCGQVQACDQTPGGCHVQLQTGFVATDQNVHQSKVCGESIGQCSYNLQENQNQGCRTNSNNCGRQNSGNPGIIEPQQSQAAPCTVTHCGPPQSNFNCPDSNPNCNKDFNPSNYQKVFNVTTQTWQYIPKIVPLSPPNFEQSGQKFWTSRPIYRTNYGQESSDPQFNDASNQFGQGSNQYGHHASNQFGQGSNQYGQGSTQYGQGSNQYGQGLNQYRPVSGGQNGQQYWTSNTNWTSRPIHHTNFNSRAFKGTNQQFEGSNQGFQQGSYPGVQSHLGYQSGQLGFQTIGQSHKEAQCPAGHSGLLPHPSICEKFLNCANGITYVQDCGPGTIFNPKLKVCDWPYNVQCTSSTTDSTAIPNYQLRSTQHHQISDSANSYQPINSPSGNVYIPGGSNNQGSVKNYQNRDNSNSYQSISSPTGSTYVSGDSYNPGTVINHENRSSTNFYQPNNSPPGNVNTPGNINYQGTVQNHRNAGSTNSYQSINNPPGNVYIPGGSNNQGTVQNHQHGSSSYQPRGTYNPSGNSDRQFQGSGTQNSFNQSQNTTGRNYIGVIGHRRPNNYDCSGANCNPSGQSTCHGSSCTNSGPNYPHQTNLQSGYQTNANAMDYGGSTGYHQIDTSKYYSGSNQDKHETKSSNCFGSQCVNPKLDFGQSTSYGTIAPSSNLQQSHKNESKIYYITPVPTNQQNYRPVIYTQERTTPKYTQTKSGHKFHTTHVNIGLPPEPETYFGTEQNIRRHPPAPFPSTDINADYNFDAEEVTELPKIGSSQEKPKRIWKSGGKCQENEFSCKINECVPKNWVCDGNQDCSNGLDETNCGSYINHFTKIPNSRLYKHEIEKWLNTDLETCANYCLNSKSFQCRSFNFRKQENTCMMCDTNVGNSGALSHSHLYDYYEISKFSINCTGMYECSNKKCINFTQVCDGNDDCGNRQDEKNCKPSTIGYEIKLAGSQVKNEGRIEIKVFGEWGFVCDDRFGLRNADVVCKELGFLQGALEVKQGSHFAKNIKDNETFYLMDDVQCFGNETSIRNCDFSGWGVHNCMPQEIVGVICKTEQEICPNERWKCDTTNECLSLQFLCDGVYDCDDHSDEGVQHCEAPVEFRLANGSSKLEGRIEIRYRGVWGTICDDDFNDNTAKVICSSMGYHGSAVAKKDGAFGAGAGPIWLDQVNCFGNESIIEDCSHWNWGEHNCEHSEDAGVVCSHLDSSAYEKKSKTKDLLPILPQTNDLIDNSFKGTCGHTGEDLFFEENDENSDIQFRVVKGSIAKRGLYPWQATIRIKGKLIKSSHWCGAVVISNKFVLTAAHCLVGFSKGSYVVRAGDYNIDEYEGSEVEAYIEDFFVHERFRQDGHMNNDIALVKLKGFGFRLNKQVQPICLPDKHTVYRPGLNCTISGFGSTESGKSTSSHVLRAGWIKIQPDDICTMEQVYGNSITNGMFCAGSLDESIDSCDGDSGGPLACLDKGLYTLYGLTSWGQRCGHANKPGVYVKIGHYRTWIDKKIEENT